jgi:hypothetical protein
MGEQNKPLSAVMNARAAGPDVWHLQPEIEARIRRKALEEAAALLDAQVARYDAMQAIAFDDRRSCYREVVAAMADAIRAL